MSSPKLKMQTLHFLSICSYPVCSGVSCHAQLGPSSMLFFLLKCHIPYWYRQQGRASSTVVQHISTAGSSLRGEGWKADSMRVHLEGMRMRTRMLGSQNCQIGQANFRCISGFWGCCFLFFFLFWHQDYFLLLFTSLPFFPTTRKTPAIPPPQSLRVSFG